MRLLRMPNGWTLTALAIAGLLAVPLVAVAISVFALPTSSAHVWGTLLPRYSLNTLALLVLAGSLASLIGVGTAWIVSTMTFPGRRLLSWILVLPLAAPAYVIAYAYTDFLEYSGPLQTWLRTVSGNDAFALPPIRNLPGAGLLLALVLYPYVYITSRIAFATQGRDLYLAARSLGLGPWSAFLRVSLPAARPAIAGGLALVLMETIADFGVADYFAIPTFSVGIFRAWLSMGERAVAMQLAGVLLLAVFALVLLERQSRRGVAAQSNSATMSDLFRLSPTGTAMAILACSLPVILGFLLPVGLLISLALQPLTLPAIETSLADFASNSFTVAGLTAILGTGIALVLAYANRVTGPAFPLAHRAITFSTLGYAIPGAVLAVGLLAPLSQIDQSLTRWSRDTFNLSHGLLLTGSVFVLVYALVVRFLTVSYNTINEAMVQLPPSMDDAARSLGASRWRVLWAIHLPVLSPSLIAGASLVFIDAIRELPATLILRPLNFETLATRVYRLASDERLSEAALPSLIIIAFGLIPVLLLDRIGRKATPKIPPAEEARRP